MQTNYQTSYEDVIKAPVSEVWKALTEPELVKQYFFGSDQQTDWQVGSPITWTGEYEGKTYVDKGVVVEYAPNERLTYSYLSSWSGRDDKPENYLRVSYEVKEVPEGTLLSITQSNYDEEKAQHSGDGWRTVVDGLKKLVE